MYSGRRRGGIPDENDSDEKIQNTRNQRLFGGGENGK